MIKQLISSYFDFFKDTKKESIIAIFRRNIWSNYQKQLLYIILAEIIRNLEYLKISNKDLNLDINLEKGLFIF